MSTAYVIHIFTGSLGLFSGLFALYSGKGTPFHRRAGMVFVYSMLTMCASGLAIAAIRGKASVLNLETAILVASLIVTATTAVRAVTPAVQWIERAGILLTLSIAATAPLFALTGIASADRIRVAQGYPLLMIGAIAIAASVGDRRWLAGRRTGAVCLRRHLWRMSFALVVAAASFVGGRARIFPAAVRSSGLLPLPVLALLGTMFWWLWRTRQRPVTYEARTPGSPVPSAT